MKRYLDAKDGGNSDALNTDSIKPRIETYGMAKKIEASEALNTDSIKPRIETSTIYPGGYDRQPLNTDSIKPRIETAISRATLNGIRRPEYRFH